MSCQYFESLTDFTAAATAAGFAESLWSESLVNLVQPGTSNRIHFSSFESLTDSPTIEEAEAITYDQISSTEILRGKLNAGVLCPSPDCDEGAQFVQSLDVRFHAVNEQSGDEERPFLKFPEPGVQAFALDLGSVDDWDTGYGTALLVHDNVFTMSKGRSVRYVICDEPFDTIMFSLDPLITYEDDQLYAYAAEAWAPLPQGEDITERCGQPYFLPECNLVATLQCNRNGRLPRGSLVRIKCKNKDNRRELGNRELRKKKSNKSSGKGKRKSNSSPLSLPEVEEFTIEFKIAGPDETTLVCDSVGEYNALSGTQSCVVADGTEYAVTVSVPEWAGSLIASSSSSKGKG